MGFKAAALVIVGIQQKQKVDKKRKEVGKEDWVKAKRRAHRRSINADDD